MDLNKHMIGLIEWLVECPTSVWVTRQTAKRCVDFYVNTRTCVRVGNSVSEWLPV